MFLRSTLLVHYITLACKLSFNTSHCRPTANIYGQLTRKKQDHAMASNHIHLTFNKMTIQTEQCMFRWPTHKLRGTKHL